MNRSLGLLAGLFLTSVFSSSALAADTTLQSIMDSPAALDQARTDGRKVAQFCANCHGANGASSYDYIPNLAGQNPAYLLEQIRKFADGRRQDAFMGGLIKAMKEQDRVNIAIYYASQSVTPTASTANAADRERGRNLFQTVCTSCHGAKGYGSDRIARLAGQHSTYISQSLKQYRSGEGNRKDPVMGSIARRLRDEDIDALAAYIPTMR